MPRPRKYPPELLDRGTRVVIESGRPIAHVARDLGVPSETLHKYVRQVEAEWVCGRIVLGCEGQKALESPQSGARLSRVRGGRRQVTGCPGTASGIARRASAFTHTESPSASASWSIWPRVS